MTHSITLTEAKAKFSELINRIVYNKDKFYISRKGKNVAVLMPLDESEASEEEGLILAQKGLADFGSEIEEMEKYIFEARKNDVSREVDI